MKQVYTLLRTAGATIKGLALFLGLYLASSVPAFSQNVQCPDNIDWEKGDHSNWQCMVGIATSGTTRPTFGSPQITGPLPNRHSLQSASSVPALDPYGKFPVVPNGGGNYALKLGKDSFNLSCERVNYYVHVPPGFNDYSFNFRFAVVLENGHQGTPSIQPAFTINAYDSANPTSVFPCALQEYVADATLATIYGFKNSDTGFGVIYLPWTGGAVPIIGQGGKTIVIEVTSYDCAAGGHFGYGYFDVVACGKYKASVTYCNLDSGIARFVGTGVTQNYNWYTSNWTLLGTGPYIDVQVPATPDYFIGVLASGTPGCLDTIYTDTISNFTLNTNPKTPCLQFGTTIQLNTQAIGGLPGGMNYNWNADPTLSCTNCQNPIASPFDTTTYFVTVTDRVGCFRRDTVHVYQAPNAGPDLKVCPLGERPVQLHVAGPPDAQFHWYDYGTNNPGQYLDCTDCTDPVSAPVPSSYTYTVGYDGCPVLDTLIVYHDTTNYIEAPQDLLLVCRPTYLTLVSEAKGPNPKLNIACGTSNNIICTQEDTAVVGIPGTPPKIQDNTPFLTTNNFIKYQFIIKKSELLYSGLYSGTINGMSMRTLKTALQAAGPIDYMWISLGCIDQNDFPTPTNNNSFYGATALTQVAQLTSYAITPDAWNDIKFDAPYSWDTSKNLLVDICIGPLSAPTATGLDVVSMEEGVAIQKYSQSINVCGGNAPKVQRYLQRPTVRFYYCATPDLPFQYTWMPGNNLQDSTVQNPYAYIGHSQDYAVYSVGRNGCKLRDSLHIYMPDHKLNAGPVDTFICKGQPAFLFASGGEAYNWFEVNEGVFSDASGSLSCTDCDRPTARPAKTTTYAVVFQNERAVGNPANPGYGIGCPDTMFITVNVWTLPNVDLINADTTITIGKSVQLYVQGAQHYTWSPTNGLSDPNAPNTMAHPTTTTTYVVTGFDMNGCTYTDSVKITLNYHTNLLIPTGFTPNGDGLNDVFRIVNPEVQRLMEFRVFNRWGQEIFTTTDISKGWDGTWKGVPQEIGTYQYIIRVGYFDNTTELYKGDVQLIK
jgi:gliding motility-associated-like protein